MMTDPVFQTATALTEAIRDRKVSAAEVVEAHLEQIKRHNGTVNAVVTLDEEGARQRAKAADAALARGDCWGPLHGLPVTLKDGHATRGMRTTVGFPPLAGYTPAEDGTVSSRLKAAGAIILGKTNVPPLMSDIQTDNPIFGRTRNPWNLEHTPGGSSGGAAAAVAAGMTPLEIGSDMGGSTRVPAHFTGIFALNPTERRVSLNGLVTAPPGAIRTIRQLAAIGPMARSVADLDLAFRVLAGPDGKDTEVAPVPLRDVPALQLKALRVAWAPAFPGSPVAAEIQRALGRLAVALEGAGSHVAEALPEIDWAAQADAFRKLLTYMITAALPAGAHGAPDQAPTTLVDYLTALGRRDQLIAGWEGFLEQHDVLICPVSGVTAFTHCAPMTPLAVDGAPIQYLQALDYCTPFNLTGHPSVVLPLGRDKQGLPLGVQLVGRRWDDERLLAIAGAIAELTGGFRRPPGY